MSPSNTISIAGNIGSGKSSVARRLAEITGWPIVSTGAIFRDLAARRGLTVLELNQQAESDRSIDDEVDGHLRRLAASGDPAIIDSRMAWHFVPASFKVYLVVDPLIAVERVYGAVREDERYDSVEEAAAEVLARQSVEAERYLDLYAVHVDDWRNYDLIVDTGRVGIDDIAGLIASERVAATRPTCHLDPQRLVPTRHGDDGPVRVAVENGVAALVSGHDAVHAAIDRGDVLIACELAAFGPDEIAGLPTGGSVRRAIDGRSATPAD